MAHLPAILSLQAWLFYLAQWQPRWYVKAWWRKRTFLWAVCCGSSDGWVGAALGWWGNELGGTAAIIRTRSELSPQLAGSLPDKCGWVTEQDQESFTQAIMRMEVEENKNHIKHTHTYTHHNTAFLSVQILFN